METPSRPQGILLEPGTGTMRKKRVSWGQTVGSDTKQGGPRGAEGSPGRDTAKRTRNAERVEDSPSKKRDTSGPATGPDKADSSDEWEEADDDDLASQDVTVDLNEPHSQSGRYWKGELSKYRDEAKTEMSKLLRYRQMAKSYAQTRDAEAAALAEKLRLEQEKVLKMEKKLAIHACEIAAQGAQQESDETVAKLARQAALAVEYRQRVQELESQLKEREKEKKLEGGIPGRRGRVLASPRGQTTLLETQRELRRARTQAKEVESLRTQVSALKAELRASERRNRAATAEAPAESSRAQHLRAHLRQAREESARKEEEVALLRRELEAAREEGEARFQEMSTILSRARTKMAELRREVKMLKGRGHSDADRSQTRRVRSVTEEQGSRGDKRQRQKLRAKSGGLEEEEGGDELGRRLVPRPDPWHLGHDEMQAMISRGATPAATASRCAAARAVAPGRSTTTAAYAEAATTTHGPGERSAKEARGTGTGIDLLQDRFQRLGGPEAVAQGKRNGPTMANSRRGGPLARDAILARAEQRQAKAKQRAELRAGPDKENVRPPV